MRRKVLAKRLVMEENLALSRKSISRDRAADKLIRHLLQVPVFYSKSSVLKSPLMTKIMRKDLICLRKKLKRKA